MREKLKISRYLKRISIDSRGKPDLPYLRKLQVKHLLSVPFENVNIWNGIKIELSIENLFDKIVVKKRGGFCYELNGLFGELLRRLGYNVSLLSARVFDKSKGEFGSEFDHLTLMVDLDRSYLVDVGFGDSFREPIPISGGISEDLSGRYRLEQSNGLFILKRYEGKSWTAQYSFSLIPRDMSDFFEMCRFNETSERSSFTRRKICTLAMPEGRVTLSDESLTFTIFGSKIRFPLDGKESYSAALKKVFDIDVFNLQG